MTENEQPVFSEVPVSELPRGILRQLEAQRLAPHPMRATPSGLIVASDGKQYVRRNGALVRVAVDSDAQQVCAIVPWSKAKRKAMKRARNLARKRT